MKYEFIESSLFTRMVYDYLSEGDYTAFQQFLMEQPEAGDLVKGSGGVRKVRWARAGAGKSGGVRVCYYTRNAAGQILLLLIYAKSVRASIPGAVLKQIKEVLDHAD
jgi:mRNA-degrading endonuclease RelE of RelBE toxin-antitoxin system